MSNTSPDREGNGGLGISSMLSSGTDGASPNVMMGNMVEWEPRESSESKTVEVLTTLAADTYSFLSDF